MSKNDSYLENPLVYEADKEQMNKKAEEALSLLKKAKLLLEESASGGLHDTGSFTNELPDKCMATHDDLITNISFAIREAKKYIKYLNFKKD